MKDRRNNLNRVLGIILSLLLIFQQTGFAQIAGELNIAGRLSLLNTLPVPDAFRPLHLRYLSYDSLNSNFKLLLDKGSNLNPNTREIEDTTKQLLDYFSIGLALPSDAFWVNLRPDGENNIIDEQLARTDMGKVMLEADLKLKKDTALATSPKTPEGKQYWDRLYKKAEELYGTDNVAIPTLTRVWIVPDEIVLSESQSSAYIYKATLKVLLEQDYLKDSTGYSFKDPKEKTLNDYSSQLYRELIIPKLTREVNTSRAYAPLRQIYYSLIMAEWFKARFRGKPGIYPRLINARDLTNLTSQNPRSKTTYFREYQNSVNKGEYDIQQTQEVAFSFFHQTARRYICGGVEFGGISGIIAKFGVGIGYLKGSICVQAPSAINHLLLKIKGAIGVNVDRQGGVEVAAGDAAEPAKPRVAQAKEETGITQGAVSLGDFYRKLDSLPDTLDKFSFLAEFISFESKNDPYRRAAFESMFYLVEDNLLEMDEQGRIELVNNVMKAIQDKYSGNPDLVKEIAGEFGRFLYDISSQIEFSGGYYYEINKFLIDKSSLYVDLSRGLSKTELEFIVRFGKFLLQTDYSTFEPGEGGYYVFEPGRGREVTLLLKNVPAWMIEKSRDTNGLKHFGDEQVDAEYIEALKQKISELEKTKKSPEVERALINLRGKISLLLGEGVHKFDKWGELSARYVDWEASLNTNKERLKEQPAVFNEQIEPLLKEGKEKFSLVLSIALLETADADAIVAALEKTPEIKDLYSKDAMVGQGYTIKEHTLMAMKHFEKYFADKELPAGMDKNLFRLMLALHDIGKPLGGYNKEEQQRKTIEIIDHIKDRLPFTDRQLNLVSVLISEDAIGSYFKMQINLEKSVSMIDAMARQAGLLARDFLKLLTVYYQSDAGSYTLDAGVSPDSERVLERIFEYQNGSKVFDESKGHLKFSEGYYKDRFRELEQRVESLEAEELSRGVQSGDRQAIGLRGVAQGQEELSEEAKVEKEREQKIAGIIDSITKYGLIGAQKAKELGIKIFRGADGHNLGEGAGGLCVNAFELKELKEFQKIELEKYPMITGLKDVYTASYFPQTVRDIVNGESQRSPVTILGEREYTNLAQEIEKFGKTEVEQRLKSGALMLMSTKESFDQLLRSTPRVGNNAFLFQELPLDSIEAIFVPEGLFDTVKGHLPSNLRGKAIKVTGEVEPQDYKFYDSEIAQNNLRIPDWYPAVSKYLLQAKLNKTFMMHAIRLPTAAESSTANSDPQIPSISSTGFGNEEQANQNIREGITEIAARQGLEVVAGEDVDLKVDNRDVFLINGQKVIAIDRDYLSVTEEGEQYASAGLRRGVVYITRQKFNEWQEQGILEQKIKHEQDEVAYLREKALEMFPDADEAAAYQMMSDFLKGPNNAKRAAEIISEAHKYAKAQEQEKDANIINREAEEAIKDAIFSGYVYTGTDEQLLDSIRKHGLTSDTQINRVISEEDYEFFKLMALKSGWNFVLRNYFESDRQTGLFVTGDKYTAAEYARSGPERPRIFARNIQELLSDYEAGLLRQDSISQEELRRLREIESEYTRKTEGRKPIVVAIPIRDIMRLLPTEAQEFLSNRSAFSEIVLERHMLENSGSRKITVREVVDEILSEEIFNDVSLQGSIKISPEIIFENVQDDRDKPDQPQHPEEPTSQSGGSTNSALMPNTTNKLSGIDFRNLPIVRKAIANLRPNLDGPTINRLKRADLDREWSRIEELVNKGVIPTGESLREYIQASCLKGNCENDLNKIISCIADIYRLEEERYCSSEPLLQDILIAIESAASAQQLTAVFVGN